MNRTLEPQDSAWASATHWSVVLAAGQQSSPQSANALEQLCRTYWYPLYAYVRRRGVGPDDAQDLTQEFFARMLQQGWLAKASPLKGKFRAFLLTALNHFLANEYRRAQAAKRGGGQKPLSIDQDAESRYRLEPVCNLTPEKLYERNWALKLFAQALARLREQYSATGKAPVYGELKQFLSAEPKPGDYAQIAQKLGMSEAGVATAVHRLRQRYTELVRAEIAHTVSTREELEEELRSLLAALA